MFDSSGMKMRSCEKASMVKTYFLGLTWTPVQWQAEGYDININIQISSMTPTLKPVLSSL